VYRDLMILNDAGEACFTIVAIGTTDAVEFVRSLHASAREDLRSALTMNEEPTRSEATFELRFAGLQSNGRPVRATLSGHRGIGLLGAQSAELKKAFAGVDAIIVRGGSDIDDDLTTSSTLIASADVALDAVVILDAPGGAPDLAGRAMARYAPRPTHTLIDAAQPLDVLKLAIKAMLSREAARAAQTPT
jgi:hypothetical protein